MGRAIRHANNYAAIVLANFWYATDKDMTWIALQWLRRGYGVPSQEDAVFGKSYEGGSFFLLHEMEMSDLVFDKQKIIHYLSTE